jgi:hypothetical protein
VSPVKYELSSYITEDVILHSHNRETSSLTSHILSTFLGRTTAETIQFPAKRSLNECRTEKHAVGSGRSLI